MLKCQLQLALQGKNVVKCFALTFQGMASTAVGVQPKRCMYTLTLCHYLFVWWGFYIMQLHIYTCHCLSFYVQCFHSLPMTFTYTPHARALYSALQGDIECINFHWSNFSRGMNSVPKQKRIWRLKNSVQRWKSAGAWNFSDYNMRDSESKFAWMNIFEIYIFL